MSYLSEEESERLKKIVKTCVRPGCERKLHFPQWYHTKARLCALCIAKVQLKRQLGR